MAGTAEVSSGGGCNPSRGQGPAVRRLLATLALAGGLQALSAAIRALGLPVTWNDGVALSAFGASPAAIVTGLAGLLVVTWLCRHGEGPTATGLVLLWGGAASNVVDRLCHGAVMDYLPLPIPFSLPLPPPLPSLPTTINLNGADVALISGALLLLLSTRRRGS